MWEQFWTDRGKPWEFDPGPAASSRWVELFAETPNYRGIGVRWSGKEEFRWHFGPMFYRGRTSAGGAKVLLVGQEGAQDESLSHRSFTGGTGGRMQHVLRHLGITQSYLYLNTFVYPIFGQYDDGLRPLAQDLRSPIAQHRQALFDLAASEHDLRLVIAVGTAAKESVATWIRSKGGDADPFALHLAEAGRVKPGLRAIGVLHPGGGRGGASTAIVADFKAALARIEQWTEDDPGWLPVDPDGDRRPASSYVYANAPVPFRDFPFGTAWRLGFRTTASNRSKDQTAIQLFSLDGRYNNRGHVLEYPVIPAGSDEGYEAPAGELPYEPPGLGSNRFDRGPTAAMAKLLQGGDPATPWPDFEVLGLPGHPSFGLGPSYRGRLSNPSVLVLADQASHDDLFFGRALTGEAGQRLTGLLAAAGIDRRYAVVRTLPVDSLGATAAKVRAATDHPQVRAVLRQVLLRADPDVVLAIGPHASRIAAGVAPAGTPTVVAKAWGASGALADWRRALGELAGLNYPKDRTGTFTWDGGRRQIPRADLPFGTLRWQGTSGDRAVQARREGKPSRDYFKVVMPGWVANLGPAPLTSAERAAVDALKG
jgi:uracil-DNA glycosylase